MRGCRRSTGATTRVSGKTLAPVACSGAAGAGCCCGAGVALSCWGSGVSVGDAGAGATAGGCGGAGKVLSFCARMGALDAASSASDDAEKRNPALDARGLGTNHDEILTSEFPLRSEKRTTHVVIERASYPIAVTRLSRPR